jgi:hypothetical protein
MTVERVKLYLKYSTITPENSPTKMESYDQINQS